jgi:hypothetical protein
VLCWPRYFPGNVLSTHCRSGTPNWSNSQPCMKITFCVLPLRGSWPLYGCCMCVWKKKQM